MKRLAMAALAAAALSGCVSEEDQPFRDGDGGTAGGQCWVLGVGNAPCAVRPI